MEELEQLLSGLVRIGIVTDRRPELCQVRVLFPDVNMTSGWLYCLQRPVSVTAAEAEGHSHSITVGSWTPAVNSTVVCLYLPVQDADGFVLGQTEGGAA